MTMGHEVANWRTDGTVYFKPPEQILRRRRFDSEQMVTLSVPRPRMDIRVTGLHRMVCRHNRHSPWQIVHAQELVGKVREFPVCGEAAPPRLSVPQEDLAVTAEQIRANAYHHRKRGMPPAEARAEAVRRAEARASLRHADPHELTLEECELIGFWLGDGSVNRGRRGGVEYILSQVAYQHKIIARIEHLLDSCGIFRLRTERVNSKGSVYYRWSLPRGTGQGPQFRPGVYRFEPYLIKQGSPLYWGFNRQQLQALLKGYWMADGCPHNDETEPPPSFRIIGRRKALFDLLQAVAVCRGMSAGIHPRRVTNPRHSQLWHLSIYGRVTHKVGRCPMRADPGAWKDERIWCVTSETGNIIIRRHGTVMVTGNTEGFDAPAVCRVAWTMPTASLVKWTQGCGRAFRPDATIAGKLAGGPEDSAVRRALIAGSPKPAAQIVTYHPSNCRHQICAAVDLLGGKELPPDVKLFASGLQEQAARAEGGGDPAEDVRTAHALADFAALLSAEARAIRAKAKVVDTPFDGLGGGGAKLSDPKRPDAAGTLLAVAASWHDARADLVSDPSPKQLGWLRYKGLNDTQLAGMTGWRASVVRDLYELGVPLTKALAMPRRQALTVREDMRKRKAANAGGAA
jgi:hypothetical protein